MAEPADSHEPDEIDGEVVAEVRHLPVPHEPGEGRALDRPFVVAVPATVAAATGGFVLGVAAFLTLKVLRRPSAARRLTRRRAKALSRRRGVDVESTRSFLVDVHLLKR